MNLVYSFLYINFSMNESSNLILHYSISPYHDFMINYKLGGAACFCGIYKVKEVLYLKNAHNK